MQPGGLRINEAPTGYTQEDLTPDEHELVRQNKLIKTITQSGYTTLIFRRETTEGKSCIYVPLDENDVIHLNQLLLFGVNCGWYKTSCPAIIEAIAKAREQQDHDRAAAANQTTSLSVPDYDPLLTELDSADLLDDEEELTYQPSKQSSILKNLKLAVTFLGHVFTDGQLKAAAWPIIMFLLLDVIRNSNESEQEADSKDYLIPAFLLWQIFAIMGMGVQYYLIGARSDGEQDVPLSQLRVGLNESAGKAAVTYLATGTEFLDGFLSGLAIFPRSYPGVVAGCFLGTGMWLKFMLSDLQALHRKYREGNPNEMPIARQKAFNWLYRRSEKIAMFLRETLGPMLGGIHSYVILNLLMEWEGHDHNKMTLAEKAEFAAPYSPLLLLTYQAAAFYTNNFEVRQMRDNLKFGGIKMPRQSALVRSEHRLVRWIGKILHGDALPETVYFLGQKGGLSPENQVKLLKGIAGVFQAAGNMALFHRGMKEYICSNEPGKGEMFRHFFGDKKAQALYNGGMLYPMWAFSFLGGATATYAKTGTVYQSEVHRQQGTSSMASRASVLSVMGAGNSRSSTDSLRVATGQERGSRFSLSPRIDRGSLRVSGGSGASRVSLKLSGSPRVPYEHFRFSQERSTLGVAVSPRSTIQQEAHQQETQADDRATPLLSNYPTSQIP